MITPAPLSMYAPRSFATTVFGQFGFHDRTALFFDYMFQWRTFIIQFSGE